MTKEEKEELIRQKENLKLLFELSKFLPTADMQADFELFKNMTPEERAMFQEKRAQKIEARRCECFIVELYCERVFW